MKTLKLHIWRDPDPHVGGIYVALAYNKEQAIALLEGLKDEDLTILESRPCEIINGVTAFHEYTDM